MGLAGGWWLVLMDLLRSTSCANTQERPEVRGGRQIHWSSRTVQINLCKNTAVQIAMQIFCTANRGDETDRKRVLMINSFFQGWVKIFPNDPIVWPSLLPNSALLLLKSNALQLPNLQKQRLFVKVICLSRIDLNTSGVQFYQQYILLNDDVSGDLNELL